MITIHFLIIYTFFTAFDGSLVLKGKKSFNPYPKLPLLSPQKLYLKIKIFGAKRKISF